MEAGGKLRNGLFLRGVALFADRVAFEVFASRPLGQEDLATLSLTDNFGTTYKMVPLRDGIDGKASIVFEPAVPTGWTRLDLCEPGWGLHIRNG
jgi:hypothetical protein